MITYRPYDENSTGDFLALYSARFPGGDRRIPTLLLESPLRAEYPSAGAVAYDDAGEVCAIVGLPMRRLYAGQTPLASTNGVAFAVRKTAPREFLTDFLGNSVRATAADLFFVNTSIPPSRKRSKMALAVEDGPESCAVIRERAVRSNGRFARLLRKMWKAVDKDSSSAARSAIAPYRVEVRGLTLTIEEEIVAGDFNAFWAAYLKDNSGLVSSRTAEELRWVFGTGLSTGEVLLVTARKQGALQGYAFLRRTDESATCWRVVDLVALRNEAEILTALVEASSDFLNKRTPAICLQITGYPTWVQPLLRRLFPKSSSLGFNKCVWKCLNEKAERLCGDWVNAPNGWYGCPYDGDMCLL